VTRYLAITLARKPLSERTVASNVLKWGTGALNISACRIGHNEPVKTTTRTSDKNSGTAYNQGKAGHYRGGDNQAGPAPEGRWPSNVLLSGEAAQDLDAQSGNLKSGSGTVKRKSSKAQGGNRSASYGAESRPEWHEEVWYGDEGGASRFFKVIR